MPIFSAKAQGRIDRVLAGQGIGHEDDLGRLQHLLDPAQFGHQLVVDMQAAGRVDDDVIIARSQRRFFSVRAPARPDRGCRR